MKYAVKPSENQIQVAWSSGEWIAQEKKDGAFYQLEKTDAGDVYMFGRTVSKKTGEYTEKSDNFPHIKEWAEENLPNGTILIGEIYIPGGKSNDVTKISGCTPTNAYKRQFESSEYQPVHYYVFDIIRFKNQDLCNMGTVDRLRYLKIDLDDIWNNEYVECAQTYFNNFEEYLKNIFDAGGEGMVFKHMNCPYRAGKRTTASQMFKYKESLDSVDLICIGLEDPTYYYEGKEADTWPYKNDDGELITKPAYYGWKNAIRVGAYKEGRIIEIGTVASGLTDADREDMAINPEKWINTVVEIQCMSTTKDGALRHPVFRRLRPDKGINDCLYDEIFI